MRLISARTLRGEVECSVVTPPEFERRLRKFVKSPVLKSMSPQTTRAVAASARQQYDLLTYRIR